MMKYIILLLAPTIAFADCKLPIKVEQYEALKLGGTNETIKYDCKVNCLCADGVGELNTELAPLTNIVAGNLFFDTEKKATFESQKAAAKSQSKLENDAARELEIKAIVEKILSEKGVLK